MFKSCRYTLTTLSFELKIYMPFFSFSEEMNIYKNNKFKKKKFLFAEKTFHTIFPANKLPHFTEQFLNFSPVFHTYLRFHCRYHQYNQLQPLNFVNLNVQNYTKFKFKVALINYQKMYMLFLQYNNRKLFFPN